MVPYNMLTRVSELMSEQLLCVCSRVRFDSIRVRFVFDLIIFDSIRFDPIHSIPPVVDRQTSLV